MHALLYRSTAVGLLSSDDIDQIVDAGMRRNALWDITGLLLHGPCSAGQHGFVQWLEGESEDVESLFARICADPRHTDIVRISEGLDLACYALPMPRQAMCAVAVECLPETVDAFLAQTAAHWEAQEAALLH